jgi:hypothetical protein
MGLLLLRKRQRPAALEDEATKLQAFFFFRRWGLFRPVTLHHGGSKAPAKMVSNVSLNTSLPAGMTRKVATFRCS